jgi:two-component system response regulator FixJ
MKLVADGLTNKGVARELDISERTVEVHRAHVMEKMEAKSLATLVKIASAAGIG